MKNRSLGALITLNITLLIALVVVTFTSQPAQAQRRGRGQFTMISGRTQAKSNQDLVYLINLDTAQVVALLYESANNRLNIVDGYDFSADLAGGGRRGGR